MIIQKFFTSYVSRSTKEYIQTIITSAQKVDNVISVIVRVNRQSWPYGVGEIKTTGNIGIYHPYVFSVESMTNQ